MIKLALGISLAGGLVGAGSSTPPRPSKGIVIVADSYQTTVVNRVVLDIAAPPAVIWDHLPGNRLRPGIERVPINEIKEGIGARYDMIYRDSTGTVTRHDRLQVLNWEPGKRFVALVRYLPPAPPLEIIYNVDLSPAGSATHFVMDSYSTVSLPSGPNPAEQAAREAAQRREWQTAVEQGYDRFKREVEAAARRP